MDQSPGQVPAMTMPLLHPNIPAGRFDLSELLEFEPPSRWHPEPGEKVQGHLVKIDERKCFGRTAPTMFVLVPPEEYDERNHRYVVVRASGVVLRGAVEQLRPVPGDRIAFKFEGFRKTADGSREYAYFQMAVRRDGRWVAAR
jgi:hypothetical protein